tara:strand:- start:245 stop:988 length:744 start_codon:yes stop_codon:yes gene_type:complete
MYKIVTSESTKEIFFDGELVLRVCKPDLDLRVLQDSFHFVPFDPYFSDGGRYRTTSRISVKGSKFELLPRKPLYQPAYVNKLDSYGAIDRDYDDVPISLLGTDAFRVMIEDWMSSIPFDVDTFSIHQIRTTDSGCPTPEGRHKDGTDWTGVYVVKRHSINVASAKTKYWDVDGNQIIDEVLPVGTLINHYDRYFTHCTSELEPESDVEPSYRDVFVITFPEHGVNKEQEEYRAKVLDAKKGLKNEFA